MKTPWPLLGASVLVVVGLGALMLWKDSGQKTEPLVVWCAAALKETMDEIVPMYEREKGVRIEVRYGKSEEGLVGIKTTKQGDVYLPADESFIEKAQQDGLLGDVLPVAKMNAVLAVNVNAKRSIEMWDDVFKGADAQLAIAAEGAAVREVTRKHLGDPKWRQLVEHSTTLGTVTDVANAVMQGGRVNAGIIWDSMLASPNYSMLKAAKLKDLEGATATVRIGIVKSSPQHTQALAFARFVSGSCADIFARHGFTSIGQAAPAPTPKDDQGNVAKLEILSTPRIVDPNSDQPEILLYAGAMLRPAIEQTIKEFEKREGVRITTVYNGCGILVSQMKAGQRPDVYFSCDTTFMNQVSDLFAEPKVVSQNQLVIAVKKGNPLGIKALTDLGKEGLRVGVGHEQQCALGAITQGVLIRKGVLKAVEQNVVLRSPSGDTLVNQLMTGASLDAVVAYVSNVTPNLDKLDAIKVEEINCKPAQPIAVSRSTAHPDVVKRLIEAIESSESKERFQKLGFGWELKP